VVVAYALMKVADRLERVPVAQRLAPYGDRYSKHKKATLIIVVAVRIAVFLFSALTLLIFLGGFFLALLGIVNFANWSVPRLLQIASSYTDNILDFAGILITASSVLLGFNLAAQAVILEKVEKPIPSSVMERLVPQTKELMELAREYWQVLRKKDASDFFSMSLWVMYLGLSCVVLSVAALLLMKSGLTDAKQWATWALFLAIITFISQTLLVALSSRFLSKVYRQIV